jgi:hypothetical protein
MANRDQPQGFKPSGELLRVRPYVAGGTVYPGDAIKLNNAGQVVVAAADDALVGVAMAYATSGQSVSVADHPDQEFVGQADGADIDAQTDMNLNYNILATAGNSSYKVSRMEVDSSTQATTATLPLKVLRREIREDNALGEFVDVVFVINNHQLKGATGTDGV